MIRIARFCTLQVRWRGIWGDRYERRTWHAYSVIGRVQVQAWNELTHGYQDRERLSWDKLYKRLLAFLMMLSMWQFHLKSLDMLRRSILALAARSIGIPSTTTGSNKVVLLVLKFIRSSLHLVSLSWKSYLRTHGLPGCQQRLGYNSLFFFLIVCEIVVSSTYFQRSVLETFSSLIIMINSHCPSFVPWGTTAGLHPIPKSSWGRA